jgi:hypothetical protein
LEWVGRVRGKVKGRVRGKEREREREREREIDRERERERERERKIERKRERLLQLSGWPIDLEDSKTTAQGFLKDDVLAAWLTIHQRHLSFFSSLHNLVSVLQDDFFCSNSIN